MEGLDLHKIGQIVLGTETPPETVDLKEICTNDNISMWAKWKPINYEKVGALTEEERRSVGYGLRTANTDIPICFSGSIGTKSGDREGSIYEWIDLSLDLYNNGGDVIWDKPTKYFRLTDFASENLRYQITGRETATYYMANGHDTYSPSLGYNDDFTQCITIDDLIDTTVYPYLDDLEVAILYKYNNAYYIKTSGHNVGYLKEYNVSITPNLPTSIGSHTIEGFFVAITPENELDTEYNGWDNIFGNEDASSTGVVAFRFPDSHFKGIYIVKDPNTEENAPRLWFDTDYYNNYYSDTDSDACIYYDRGGILNIRTMLNLHADESEYSNIEVTVFTKHNGEPNSGSSADLNYSDYGEYCYTIEVQVVQDFGENIGDIEMKIRYKVDNSTYWINLTNGNISKTEPSFVKISNIYGIREA